MKIKSNPVPLAFGGVGGGLIGVILSNLFPLLMVLPADMEQIVPVKLKPIGNNGGVLKVDQANRCNNDQHPGCLRFERNTKGYMRFYIAGEKLSRNCDTGARRFISDIELASSPATSQDNSTANSKGDFTGGVDPWLAQAFKSIDRNTGVIYQAEPENEFRWPQVIVENKNNHEATDGVMRFWYKVTVTDCDDNERTWITDPRGDNEGKN